VTVGVVAVPPGVDDPGSPGVAVIRPPRVGVAVTVPGKVVVALGVTNYIVGVEVAVPGG
jgi:hypothetical protein